MTKTAFSTEQRQEIGDWIINAIWNILSRLQLTSLERNQILKDVRDDIESFSDNNQVPANWQM